MKDPSMTIGPVRLTEFKLVVLQIAHLYCKLLSENGRLTGSIPTLLHRFSNLLFSLSLRCSWEVLQDLGSDHLSFLRSERAPRLKLNIERKDFSLYACNLRLMEISLNCPSTEEYSSLFLSSAAALYFSDTEWGQTFHSFRPHQTPS